MIDSPLKSVENRLDSSWQRPSPSSKISSAEDGPTVRNEGAEREQVPGRRGSFAAADMANLMKMLKEQTSSLSLDDCAPTKDVVSGSDSPPQVDEDEDEERLEKKTIITEQVLSRASKSFQGEKSSIAPRVMFLEDAAKPEGSQEQSSRRLGRKRIQRLNAMLVPAPRDDAAQPAFKLPDRKKTPTFITQAKLSFLADSKKATTFLSDTDTFHYATTTQSLEEETPPPPPPSLHYRISSFGTNLFTDAVESSPMFTTKTKKHTNA